MRFLTAFCLLGLAVILGLPATACMGQQEPTKVKLALNWVPEPEFGGFYAAQINNAYRSNGLEVEILPGGAGAPVVQMVAAGQVEFGIASADEVVIARSKGADLVAVFTVYQTNPQGIMVHEELGLTSLEQVFKSGLTIAMEPGLGYGKFLQKTYGFEQATIVPYAGGVAPFLADKKFAQQCFVFSEPIAAQRQGAKPRVFLVAESGYNPYTAVVVVRGDYLKKNRSTVAAMVRASRSGWEEYLKNPTPANQMMGKLNPQMDDITFAMAAKAQEPLVHNDESKANGLGTMTEARWTELAAQLLSLGIIDKAPRASECFVNVE